MTRHHLPTPAPASPLQLPARVWPGPGAAALGLTLALLVPASSARAADPVVEKLDHAEIDWTEGAVIATGSGAPNLELSNVAQVRLAAERAAKLDGYRHVLEALKGIEVTVEQSGKARLAVPSVKAQVEGAVRGCKVQDTRYYSDGGVDVVLRCPLEGGLATALAPTGARVAPRKGAEAKHSGLIVDASDVKAKPVLFPTVIAEDGAPVLEPRMISAEAIRASGAVAYVRSLGDAKSHPRAGSAPLVLDVAEIARDGTWKLDPDDAEALEGVDLGFLKDGKVVVVLTAAEGN